MVLNRHQKKYVELISRYDDIKALISLLESEIKQIESEGEVAAPDCWLMRYQARGRKSSYWYYKLQAEQPIFLTRQGNSQSRYKHLGKAGSAAYLEAVEQIARRAKIEALQRAITILKAGLLELHEEGTKN